MPDPKYRRVLLKLSGEGLCGEGGFGIENQELAQVAAECVGVAKAGVQLAIVIGGGNIVRGAAFSAGGAIGRAAADQMGMLATVINSLALQEAIEKLGHKARVHSAVNVAGVCEPFVRKRAIHQLEEKRIVILAGGTGNPFFTTDTAAALRAAELGCDAVLKATKVDGIYSADPRKDRSARLFRRITYKEVLDRRLGVMDLTAIALMMENRIPLVVFNMKTPGNIARVVRGEDLGTAIDP